MNWANLYGTSADSEYSGIAVIVGAMETGRRVVGKARELADSLGCYVKVYGPASDWGLIGADQVFSGGTIAKFLEQEKPEVVLLAPEAVLLEPVLRWAQKNSLAAIGPCFDVSIDISTREAAGRRTVMAGAMIADVGSTGKPQIFAMDVSRLPEPLTNPSRTATISALE